MRRLVLVLFALALLCQGAWAAGASARRFGGCCGAVAAASADAAVHPAGATAHDDSHAPCDAAAAPCDDEGCHCHCDCQCHGPGLTGLPINPPTLPAVAPGAPGTSLYLCQVPDHVPDSPLRPPHTDAA